MEPEGSSPYTQEPATCPYPEPSQDSHLQKTTTRAPAYAKKKKHKTEIHDVSGIFFFNSLVVCTSPVLGSFSRLCPHFAFCLCYTTHNTNIHEPAIPAIKRLQIHTFDHAATGIACWNSLHSKVFYLKYVHLTFFFSFFVLELSVDDKEDIFLSQLSRETVLICSCLRLLRHIAT
jgi:hypothetical protein